MVINEVTMQFFPLIISFHSFISLLIYKLNCISLVSGSSNNIHIEPLTMPFCNLALDIHAITELVAMRLPYRSIYNETAQNEQVLYNTDGT